MTARRPSMPIWFSMKSSGDLASAFHGRRSAPEKLQIAGDDRLAAGLDRRCQHLPAGWIRELESFGEGFVTGDQAVPDCLVHHYHVI